METVLSSRLAGARECGGSLRAYPRRRRRRSICPISAVARLECAPSAAYPLSPRRREIIRPPLWDRAEGRRVRERSSIYSGSSAHANVARKNKSEGCRHSLPRRSTMGWSSCQITGSSFSVVTSTDSPTRQNLRLSSIRHKLSQLKHFAGNHLTGTRAGMPAGSPPSSR